jgi:hypothetical protein
MLVATPDVGLDEQAGLSTAFGSAHFGRTIARSKKDERAASAGEEEPGDRRARQEQKKNPLKRLSQERRLSSRPQSAHSVRI